METTMKPFGVNLSELLEKNRVSISELARGIGEPAKTISEWLGPKGRAPRSLDCIPKIASFFKVSTHHLLTGEDDPITSLGNLLEKTELHVGLYEVSIKKINKFSGKSE